MCDGLQIDLFSIKKDKKKRIKYDFHYRLINLGFFCDGLGKNYRKSIDYKKYIINFNFKMLYPNCYSTIISWSKDRANFPFYSISFITDDEIGKRIFYNDDILINATYITNFKDVLEQFIMRYEVVASKKDKKYRDNLYKIRDEDLLKVII